MQVDRDIEIPPEINNLPLAFDLWEFTTAPAEGDLSYGLPDSAGEEIARWEINLPADPDEANAVLQRRGAYLQASQAMLEAAPENVDQFVQKAGGQRLGEVAYDLIPVGSLTTAEQDALRLLTYLEVGPDEVSFAVGEQSRIELEQASQQFESAVERMLRLVSHFSWVETSREGRLSGRTVVNWSGDMHNVWDEWVEPEVYGMHQQAVYQALMTRNIMVHACVVTTQSAAKLAVLLTNPASAILALPVAWKLVDQIMKDVEKYRKISNQEMNNAE